MPYLCRNIKGLEEKKKTLKY